MKGAEHETTPRGTSGTRSWTLPTWAFHAVQDQQGRRKDACMYVHTHTHAHAQYLPLLP